MGSARFLLGLEINMATQTSDQPAPAKQTKVQAYVNRQLDQTRRRVKMTDLITRIIVAVLLVLVALQVLAIIDAWVWSFGTFGRWACFALIVIGAIAYVGLAIVPLFLRKIHPDYAARMIEEARPTFKNSLLNYVSLRKKPEQTHAAIMDAVSKQAALDLQTVPEDATVDQSNLIKAGMFLLGVICFAVLYWLISPKDPLQSISRILLPSVKQSAPSVVQVTNVTPGDKEVFFGDRVEIGATVKGSFNPQDVILVFSTVDGQLVGQQVSMQPESEASRRFTALLPVDQAGLQQSLSYHVIARDGKSPDYDLVVKANPSIALESVTVTPPAYTRLPEETLTGQQSIEAPEGSRVRLVAKANLPIKVAYIELLSKSANASDDFRIVESITMTAETDQPQMAAGSFLAVLNADRTAPRATHYRLKFVSTTDDRNLNANVSPIRVIADLEPELEVLNPPQNQLKLPVNETLLIDARAFDIDYGISSIELKMDSKGSSLFPVKKLPLQSEQGRQRVRGHFLFKPEKHFLRPGDTAVFTLTANDNRVSHLSGMLDPNSIQSRQYQVEITDAVANPKQAQPPKSPDQKDQQDKNPDQQSEEGAEQDSEQNGDNSAGGGDSSEQEQSGDSDEGEQSGGDKESE